MGTQRQGSGKTRVTCRSNAPKPLWNYSYVGCPVAIRSSVLHRLFDSPSGGIMRWYQIFMVVSIREVMRMTWDLNALWTCTNRMNSVISQEMLPMQRKYYIGTRKKILVGHKTSRNLAVLLGFRESGFQEEIPTYPH